MPKVRVEYLGIIEAEDWRRLRRLRTFPRPGAGRTRDSIDGTAPPAPRSL